MADKPEIILTNSYIPAVVKTLEERYTVHKLWLAPDPAALLKEVGPRIRALATSGIAGAPRAMLDALPNLGLIACHGVGVDAIDLDETRRRGIPVTTTPGVLTEDVADMGLALLLAVCRKVPPGDSHVRSGNWGAKQPFPLGKRVHGKRAGIVGLGQIGTAIARRLEAFAVTVSYVDVADKPVPYRRHASVAAMAKEVDFLIAAAAGGASSHKIIGAEVLRALGPEGVLINIARGSLVDEDALLAALESGGIWGAGLDVFDPEPNVNPRFQKLANVVMSPHQSSGTVETRIAMGNLVIANLDAFYAVKPLVTPLP